MVGVLAVGIAANEHDSSVAVADEDRVLAVLEAERVTRIKHRWSRADELERLVELALTTQGCTVDDVTHWCGTVMGNTLFPREERLCESVRRMPLRICGRTVQFLAVNHHLAHAAGAFFTSPFRKATVDVCDAGGDGRSRVVFSGRRDQGRASLEEHAPKTDGSSLTGTFYDVCSYYLYKKYMQEGRFMGLASYGSPDPDAIGWLTEHVSELSHEAHERSYDHLHERFGIDQFVWRDPQCRDFAAAVQEVFVRERVRQVNDDAAATEEVVLCGGTALNIHANARLRAERAPADVYVPPCCDDSGQALGALLYALCVELGAEPTADLPFLGLGVTHDSDDLPDSAIERVVDVLVSGHVVAWHWGRAEIGPRALGHRSLLASPVTIHHRKLVSERIKGREPYRPVAPIVLADQQHKWFGDPRESPYMLFAGQATGQCKEHAPGVVHVDGTARLQTVDGSHVLWKVLRFFFEVTGVPLLINTSLNGPSEPICQTAQDTLRFCARHPDIALFVEGARCDL